MEHSTRRITAPRGSVTENAFFALEAMECDNMLSENISPVVLNLPDSDNDDDDDDFEQPLASSSAIKSIPSSTKRRISASQLRDDRASMTRQSSSKLRRQPYRKQELGPIAKRKLDFSCKPKSSLKYSSDNSELSGTEEDDDYKPSQAISDADLSVSNDDRFESPKRRRPRLSTVSLITPSGAGGIQRSSAARRIPPRAPRRTPINLDLEDSSDDGDEDIPLSSMRRKLSSRASSTSKGNPSGKSRSMKNNVEIVDLVTTPPRTPSRVNMNSPLGTVEVKSSLYPLPVITPSPLRKKYQSVVGGSSLKRRRAPKILESDDDSSAEDEKNESKWDILRQPIVICERPSPLVPAGPSKSARKLMDQTGAAAATGMEWYQERSIDEFSDSDSPVPKTKSITKTKKRRVLGTKAAPAASLKIVLGNAESPTRLNRKNIFNSTKLREAGSFASIGQSISLAKSETIPPNTPLRSKTSSAEKTNTSRQSIFTVGSNKLDTSAKPKKRALKSMKRRSAYPLSSSGKDFVTIYSDDEDLIFPAAKHTKQSSIEYVPSSDENPTKMVSNEVVDKGPPPFRLEMFCEQGESVMDMIQRLGEDEVLDKIVDAQNDGRTVIGAEELGISSEPPKTSAEVNRLRNAVQSSGRKKRANSYDPEKAMSGEYQFNYRGKKSENDKSNGKVRGKSAWRGRRGRTGGHAR